MNDWRRSAAEDYTHIVRRNHGLLPDTQASGCAVYSRLMGHVLMLRSCWCHASMNLSLKPSSDSLQLLLRPKNEYLQQPAGTSDDHGES